MGSRAGMGSTRHKNLVFLMLGLALWNWPKFWSDADILFVLGILLFLRAQIPKELKDLIIC
jgi:hypothetical protein